MMSAADLCTLLRVVLAPLFAYALARAAAQPSLAPFAVCLAAMATDFADGRLARRAGSSSEIGRFLDHGADALFLFPGLFVLAAVGRVPLLMPCAAVLAFALYVLDGLRRAGGTGGIVLAPSRSGALAGIANYGLAAAGAFALACRVPHLDAVLHAGAIVIALMNVAAALDRAYTLVRASRPAPA
jgi:phosphatidylglycerophosphate synthase